MGTCGAAGPEMGIRADGTQYFRAGNYVLEDVKFANSPSSVPQLRLEKMEALGIHRQLVSPNPITYFYHAPTKDGIEFSRRHNNQMAEVCRIHSQLVGVATLPLQDVQASCEELRRAVNDLGLVASYLGTNIAGRPLSDPCFADLWATHEKLGVPVMLHSAPRGVYEDPGPFFSQWELDVISGFNVDEGIAVRTFCSVVCLTATLPCMCTSPTAAVFRRTTKVASRRHSANVRGSAICCRGVLTTCGNN